MTNIGFIGLGKMGRPMAGHMLDGLPAGDSLILNDIRRDHLTELFDKGAKWAETPRELAEQAEVVFFMVPAVPHVKAVLEGENGLLAGVSKPIVLVVSSTVAPEAVRELDAEVSEATNGLAHVVDAPVSGGEVGSIAGTLSIMVGGEAEYVEKALPYLSLTGKPVHLGPLGAGEVAKACNQLICAATILATAEASVVAERAGLDVAKLFDLLKGGYAGSKILEDKGPRYAAKNYEVSGAAWLWIKDLEAYLDEAGRTSTATVQGDRLLAAFRGVVDGGMGDEDTAIVQKWIAEQPYEG